MARRYRPRTQNQIRAEANRRLNLMYNPMRKDIVDQSTVDIGAIQAAARAAADLMGGLGTGVQQAYDTAGHSISDFAGGFTGEMADQMRQSELGADAFAKKQGGSYASPVNADAAKNALFGLGGFIPSASLEKQGAAARTEAEAQPGIIGAGGIQSVVARQNRANQDLIELAAKKPDMLQQIMDTLYQRENDLANLSIQQQAQDTIDKQYGETVRHNKAGEQIDRMNLQQQYDQAVLDHQLAIAKAKAQGSEVDASASKGLHYLVDQYGNPILDKNGQRIKFSGGGSASKPGNSGYQKAVQNALELRGDPIARGQYDLGQGKYKARPGKSEYRDGTTDNPKNARHDGEMSFGQAQNYLVNTYGITRKQARRALIAAGWPPPAAAGKKPGYIPGTKNRGPGGTGPR